MKHVFLFDRASNSQDAEMLLAILPGGRGRGRTPTDSKNPKTNQFPQEYIANGPPKPTPIKPRATGTGGGFFFFDLGVTVRNLKSQVDRCPH